MQNSQTFQGYIFRILHHFATKLYSFTDFKVLFKVVMKILFILPARVDYHGNCPFHEIKAAKNCVGLAVL